MRSIRFQQAAAGLGAAILLGAAAPMPVPHLTDAPVPHRAIYRIGLAHATESSGIISAEGRMVFEINGSSCDGFTMGQRLVVRLGDSEGGEKLLDFRVSTFEAGTGDTFRFLSRTYVDDDLVEDIDGVAKRNGPGIQVKLQSPPGKTLTLAGRTLFPSQHLNAILAAARRNERFLSAEIYEGGGADETSDTATAVIGAAHEEKSGEALIGGLRSWPVSVAYFSEAEKEPQDGGEETPAYQISFKLFENGVTQNLVMDYGDYALSGTIEKLEALERPRCE
ncbi:cell envelope integrity EipB family protein [Propylenella binzhouense]|nr:cell envelope integrity EipB family protein [Propylenella binzhouense]